jgi:hypothetical protein
MGILLVLAAFRWAWSADPPLHHTEMSDEEIVEHAFPTGSPGRSMIERRLKEASGPERDAILERLLPEASSAEVAVADLSDAELVNLILSAPGPHTQHAAYAALEDRVRNAATPAVRRAFSDFMMDRIDKASYPDWKDQSEAARRARDEYLQLGRIAARCLPENEALQVIKGMTIEREMEGYLNLMARMLAAVHDPGPDTITLVESILSDSQALRKIQFQHDYGDTRNALFLTLSHCGDPGLDALLRVGGWESSPLGLNAVASMQGDRPRDVLIAQYERGRTEKGFADPFVLQALAKRLNTAYDPVVESFLRSEIPKHLTIPVDGTYNVSSLGAGLAAASFTEDPYYLPYLRDFQKAMDNGEGLRGATDYKAYPVAWRENVLSLLESIEKRIAKLEKVETQAVEATEGN